MPIDYKKYHPKWKLIRRLILKRAENKCEFCGIENYRMVDRGLKEIRIILTIAHLDHDINNNRFDNLKALCQKCHLNYDKDHHKKNRTQTRKKKMGQIDLF